MLGAAEGDLSPSSIPSIRSCEMKSQTWLGWNDLPLVWTEDELKAMLKKLDVVVDIANRSQVEISAPKDGLISAIDAFNTGTSRKQPKRAIETRAKLNQSIRTLSGF